MELNKDRAAEWWMEDLNGELDSVRKVALMDFLEENPELRQELLETANIWNEMEKLSIPEPAVEMDRRFGALLSAHQHANAASRYSFGEKLGYWFQQNWITSLTSLCIGLFIGVVIISGNKDGNGEIAQLSNEVHQMKKMMMLTLIEKPQAQDRIRAVNMVSDMSKSDEKVTQALIFTLNEDESVNVRLAALEALISYGDKAFVREALVRSIARQNSPLMQVALADAMLLLQEKSAVDEFNEILRSSEVDENVKSKLELTIETLKEI